ncbi:DUF3455 domain-containing protein [Archangium violaceum]|uniref:DUF3455 domain-containing protein n=1 Tax=Archangium violaceum TaxID=83451 RepID=UPI002B2CDC58|nr:DUF3455 domain-containing protein [Archangium gephyra]
MSPFRVKSQCVIAALVLSAASLMGCDDDEDTPDPGETARAATEATRQISQYAPVGLPGNVPEVLLQVTLGGAQYDLRDLLGRPSGSRPSARIVSAYKTVDTPAEPPPLGTPAMSIMPDYTRSASAAQVYECRQSGSGFAWVFLQPEAGLEPLTTQPVQALETLTLDHFRYPGAIDYGPPTGTPPAGASWRVSAPALDTGVPTFGQSLFIGAVEASVPNGPDNVPLLRVANVARIDQGLPSEVFSRTSSDGTQTGYVLRLNTLGGIAPVVGCGSAEDVGKRERVPYAADYYFIDVLTSP